MLQSTEFIWMNGSFVAWNEAKVHVLTHTLHYGGGCFEGIRAYKTERGTAIFRLKEHIERLVYSSSALQMKLPFSVQELCDATIQLIIQNKIEHCYIRPLAFYGYGVMGLKPQTAPVEVMIACWPWGKYIPVDALDVKVSKIIRIDSRSTVVDAKICGHYVNSMLATFELKGTHYHEALMLDSDGNIAEGPAENVFLVKDGEIHTPKLGKILAGITRATIIELAQSFGINVIEREIPLNDVFSADEVFFTGTAFEVAPARSIDDKLIGDGSIGPVVSKIKAAYEDIVQGRDSKFDKFLTFVS